ncbi:RNA 3'-terminal phosphate cyclase [Haloarchaeobius sp. HRN-SO-5]|uniref:RNA 3'-terminal phosphate cyclase n=1 Tax=Haloarchaeobius sp. HRN-SO-5 TaxID=3446118 RepID=UPI003EBA7FF1
MHDGRTIDGKGGGGQILRSALSLSTVTGDPVRVENVRGNRPNPGLKHQHLAGVRALATVCDADVEGDELDSETVAFDPGDVSPGEYTVDVGTAGATSLVFEVLLPLSVVLDAPLSVTVTGGTDVAWSPTLDYYRAVRLPLARRAGVHAAVEVTRRGFYPRGGGETTIHVTPGAPRSLSLTERGDLRGVRVFSVESTDLSNAEVARRQATAAAPDLGVPVLERVVRTADAPSAGSAVLVRLDYEGSVAGFSALGERGTPAEAVGESAAEAAADFHANATATVDEHTGDQLVMLVALCGGRVRLPAVTDHVTTNVGVARAFGYDVTVDEAAVPGPGAMLSG